MTNRIKDIYALLAAMAFSLPVLADDEADPDCDPDLLAAERWLAAHPLDDDEPADDGRYRQDLTH